jgi:hypothetical protein
MACSFEPGSVMAMKRDPARSTPTAAFARSKKYCFRMLGSTVLPDLLETMKSVRAYGHGGFRELPQNAVG